MLSVIYSQDSLDPITKVNDRIKAIAEVYIGLIGEASEVDEPYPKTETRKGASRLLG